VLELFTSHYGLEAAALELAAERGGQRMFVHPPAVTIPELASGSLPPGWTERRIEYPGRQLARLLHPRRAAIDSSVMESLVHQLAVAIHGAELWGQTVRQDRERQVLVSRLLNASEEERKRIARELHDEIAQLLTVIQLSLDKVEAQTPAVERAKQHLKDMQGEVRRIIRDLRPSAIDDLGLPAVISSHAKSKLVAHGIAVNLEVERDVSASPEVGIALFRVFQELVTNVLRHAKAENVSVELYRDGSDLVLAVEDDGVGFDASGTTGGAGLVGIRERAAIVGGEVLVDSEPGMGTHVVVRIRDEA
jgi:signal transduction histidine kinase